MSIKNVTPVDLALVSAQTVGPAVRLIYTRQVNGRR